ncbi:hypothetical protein Taro_001424 [Colocasia esculenta]|uniref:Uncharacterized protein n=1 Tax=Colocasia esculenta TaxID=4460 RepID=A0A843THX8_COLES|nr:hypothetical protein [Colocasia esculenta]
MEILGFSGSLLPCVPESWGLLGFLGCRFGPDVGGIIDVSLPGVMEIIVFSGSLLPCVPDVGGLMPTGTGRMDVGSGCLLPCEIGVVCCLSFWVSAAFLCEQKIGTCKQEIGVVCCLSF